MTDSMEKVRHFVEEARGKLLQWISKNPKDGSTLSQDDLSKTNAENEGMIERNPQRPSQHK